MLPDNVLSTTSIPATFSGPRGLPVTKVVDYEYGGIALNDPSQGHLYQIWRTRLIGDEVLVDALEVPEFVLYTATGLSEINLTFDQNMRPILAFVKDGRAYLRWYDSDVGAQVITALATDVITPRVTLDDKRPLQSAVSDVILGYVRGGFLRTRIQRDRFTIEYTHAAVPAGLIKIGMSSQLRLQFMMEVV